MVFESSHLELSQGLKLLFGGRAERKVQLEAAERIPSPRLGKYIAQRRKEV